MKTKTEIVSDQKQPSGRRRLPDLYSLDEIATSFGFSREAIARRVRNGEFGKVIRFGDGRIRVRFSAIEEFLERYECAGTAVPESDIEGELALADAVKLPLTKRLNESNRTELT